MGIERQFLEDEPATIAAGKGIAAGLKPGDLVLLQGGLGAGKTTLARAIVRTLADDPLMEVPSPSFALVQPYETPNALILHADLYRLAHEGDISELGLFDRPEAIVLIEWPERVPALMAQASVFVRLDIPADGVGRAVEIAR
ncbi:MAG: tRNA (adenosine(37)-N6)-threonylcarbamoyltransferase complex ATPase subunit type 1 TsaE [Devosia sp.]